MKLSPSNVFLRILNLIAYVAMIGMNYLANALPLGWKSTALLSETYPSLFVPAGYVFLIWWVIYFLLGWFIIFQFLDLFLKRHEKSVYEFIERKSGWFVLSCLLNIWWLLAWHLEKIGLSLLTMTWLFLTLSYMYGSLWLYSSGQHPKRFILFYIIPVRVYFGWISVAIFANIAALFASMWLWQSLNAQIILSSLLLLFAIGFFAYVLRYFRDYIFSLVGVWAIIGILLKRLLTDPVETYLIILVSIFWLMVLSYLFWKSFSQKL